MVYRIYVEKKPGFDVEAEGLKKELLSLLGVAGLTGLRLLAAASDRQRIISAGNWGKWKTAWQMIAIIATFILLAVREDLLPYLQMSKTFLRQYDAAFVITSWVLSTLVVLVTVISGWKYFADHWDLVTAEM